MGNQYASFHLRILSYILRLNTLCSIFFFYILLQRYGKYLIISKISDKYLFSPKCFYAKSSVSPKCLILCPQKHLS